MTENNRNRGSPRLIFTAEERADPMLARSVAKAEKAGDKAESAQKRLKTHRRLMLTATDQAAEKTLNAVSEPNPSSDVPTFESALSNNRRARVKAKEASASADTAQGKTSVGITRPDVPPKFAAASVKDSAALKAAIKKKTVRLHFEETTPKPPSKMHHPIARTLGTELHKQVNAANEDENVAVQAVLKGDEKFESALKMGENAYHAHKLRPYRKAEKAERALDKANLHALQTRAQRETPYLSSNPYSRWQQKRAIRREYAAAKAGRPTSIPMQQTAKSAEKAAATVGSRAKKLLERIGRNPKLVLVGLLAGLLLVVMSSLQACTPLAQSVLQSIVIGTYPATEDDVRAAERAYLEKERALKDELEHYEAYHPGYDAYSVDADEIWHDPYVLIAIISAYYDGQDWTIDSAYPVIEKYFKLQYIVKETITSETRYNTETRTGTRLVTDPETGRTYTETYTYEVNVPYSYKTCTVTMENKNLSHLPVYSMSHHTMGMYALYMATHGNMEGIFSGPYASLLRDPLLYDIPQETLNADSAFAALMEEANQYVGYPYVWGGASPETSFDCSGFVSYVFTHSGVYNTGRLGATGLHGLCRTVSEYEVRPGDLVFFEGTMGEKEDGITHVGIYVGNQMMIHCGSPIGYANLTDSYWRQHFYSYGRIPY